MNKCREAFEKKFPIPAHWIEFDEKRNKYYCPYVADAKAFEYQEMWEVWQSRQAEVDQLKNLLEKDEHAHNLYYENANLQTLVEEKDKRIEKAIAKWISIVTILTTTDTGVPDVIFKQLDQLHDALCGMNEIGDNNANS